jgi:hypothetical protein
VVLVSIMFRIIIIIVTFATIIDMQNNGLGDMDLIIRWMYLLV